MLVETRVDDLKVVYQGVVHLDGQDSFEIWIEGWHCVLKFVDDEGNSRYTGQVVDDALEITMFNHRNSLGESITRPFIIAQRNGKPIWMTYYTAVIGEKNIRRFEYLLWSKVENA